MLGNKLSEWLAWDWWMRMFSLRVWRFLRLPHRLENDWRFEYFWILYELQGTDTPKKDFFLSNLKSIDLQWAQWEELHFQFKPMSLNFLPNCVSVFQASAWWLVNVALLLRVCFLQMWSLNSFTLRLIHNFIRGAFLESSGDFSRP